MRRSAQVRNKNTKITLTAILLFFVIVVFCGIIRQRNIKENLCKHLYFKEIHLDRARRLIRDSPESLKKTYPLENRTGICYFNCAFQIFMTQIHLVKFFLLQDFTRYQPACRIFQKYIARYLCMQAVDLVDMIYDLWRLPRTQHVLRINTGGSVKSVVYMFMRLLYDELQLGTKTQRNSLYGNPQVCHICNFKQNIYISQIHPPNIAKQPFSAKSIGGFDSFVSRLYDSFCWECKKFQPFNLFRSRYSKDRIGKYIMIEDFYVFLRSEINLKKHKIHHKLIFDSVIFRLYAIVWFEKNSQGNHVYVTVKKNNEWFLCNDRYVKKIAKIDHSNQKWWMLFYEKAL